MIQLFAAKIVLVLLDCVWQKNQVTPGFYTHGQKKLMLLYWWLRVGYFWIMFHEEQMNI